MRTPIHTSAVALGAALVIGAAAAGCDRGPRSEQAPLDSPADPVPNVVTADIQAGIEIHIDRQIRKGGGYFQLRTDEHDLSLKLVRVHTEYLSNLGPRRHFACVDLVDTTGDVYDVDFFLAGDPGAMRVTETTVHKINGRPVYLWKQKADRTWRRAPVENATHDLLGVVRGSDAFEFVYRATLPRMTEPARMWVPLAASDSFQTVEVKTIRTPGKRQVLEEPAHGNKVLFVELSPADSGKTVEIRYDVRRREKAAYPADASEAQRYLEPERLVPADETFAALAEKATRNKQTDLVRARAVYDHVIDRMRYAKFGAGWGRGDAVYACNAGNGNCTDYHAYFIALARAVGIPARFAIGAAIPSNRNDGGVDGYHCWVEFYADGKWWPVDISEADKYSSLSTYYFGHHPANRIEFSRGRDLKVAPGPAAGPINFLAYPVLEVGGKPAETKIQFSFIRPAPDDPASG